MDSNKIIKISVRNLVEFVLRSGNLISSFKGTSRNVDAIKAHQYIQKSAGEKYNAEVSLCHIVNQGDISIEISGRADGIIIDDNDITIDEIKTTMEQIENIDEEYNILHWAQVKCYAYMYCIENDLKEVGIRLTYFQIDTKELKYLKKLVILEELEVFFYDLINQYMVFAKMQLKWNAIRDNSIKKIEFPHEGYRKGQRKLSVSVYRTIVEEKRIFIQAPTGIGKTIGVLFPSVKAVGEGLISKIFYLTAKTTTANLAEKAFDNMRNSGLKLKTLTLTAKEKICFKDKPDCDPEKCEFARGHFDRINSAIENIFSEDYFDRQTVEKYAVEYRVCPFEFSLDLANWADCIICDYNYVFDPRVYLKRFFGESGGEYCLLIDEAHNLVDRSREMFSAELNKKTILDLKKVVKGEVKNIYKSLDQINKYFIDQRKACEESEENFCISKDPPTELYGLLRNFVRVSDKWLTLNEITSFREDLLNLYFEALRFIRTFEYYDERFITYVEKSNSDVKIKLFCLDPSKLLDETLKRVRTAVFFSATLSPSSYFIKILGGNEKSYKLTLSSPFPRENLCLIVMDNISTKYKVREKTYDNIADVIKCLSRSRKGNYLTFFPSYKYMEEIYNRYKGIDTVTNTMIQTPGMKEKEREEYLLQFSSDNSESLMGFAVMGGIFGEGIDLTGEALSGAVIIGVGLPQICLERNIIKDYFQGVNGRGFEYAYMYPGMNKVMQAVGRVIRTESDRGVVLLIDERFSRPDYESFFPLEWLPSLKIRNLKVLDKKLKEFWEE